MLPTPAAPFANGGVPPLSWQPAAPGQPRGCRAEGGRGAWGTAAELHGVATTIYDLRAANFATEPWALAVCRCAESTVFAWARQLRGVCRAGLLYVEQSRADALARHVVHLAATGKFSAGLWGTMSAVCMAQKLQLVRPTVCPIHWAVAAGAGRSYNSEPSQHVWGTLGMLCTMAMAVRSETDFAVLALAIFSGCHSLRVGEAASMCKTDVKQLGWITFYDRKTKRRWIWARLGICAERCRQAMQACRVVRRRA